MDSLIKLSGVDGRLNMFYSTPELYTRAKAAEIREGNITLQVKHDDFFPYADGAHQYWTGYYTSRPALKRYIRRTSAIVQFSRQLGAVSPVAGYAAQLRRCEEMQGGLQHHDEYT